MEVFTNTVGPYASHFNLASSDNNYIGQLTLDWSYDSFYFKYKNEPWIILSYGPRGDRHEPEKFDCEDKIIIFSKLGDYAFSVLNNTTYKDAIIALEKLQKFIV